MSIRRSTGSSHPFAGYGSNRLRNRTRWTILLASLGVLTYSCLVLWIVAFSGDIGLRCIFGTRVKAEVTSDFVWKPDTPVVGDEVLSIGPVIVRTNDYTDIVEGQRHVGRLESGAWVTVRWLHEGQEKVAQALVRRRPTSGYLWSVLWFLQEVVIFSIGALVYWTRPRDESARIFFWLCVVTVGAYMGGYHWSEIVIARPLIYLFAPFAMLVPVVSLHFYLVFPTRHPLLEWAPKATLRLLYGLPIVYLAVLWTAMAMLSLAHRQTPPFGGSQGLLSVLPIQGVVEFLALGYVGLAVVIFGICIAILLHNYLRAQRTDARNQVRWILLASLLASPFVAYTIWTAIQDRANLGLDSAAWPMYVVSLLYTLAYAFSITRYKLMRAEDLLNRSMRYLGYLGVSALAGLAYSCLLVVGAFLLGYTLQDNQPSREALVVALTVTVILAVSGMLRQRIHRMLERRLHREKYKVDQALLRMSETVETLVDREAVGRQVLESANEVLHVEWGAVYLKRGHEGHLELVASLGPRPEEVSIGRDNPLVERLAEQSPLRVPYAMGLTPSDPAMDAMIRLGGEIASALVAEDGLAGIIVLGPRRDGAPFGAEDTAFLAALGSMAKLGLHAVNAQETLERLNEDLRGKVEKIGEQQRRILVLQEQLQQRVPTANRRANEAADEPVETEAEVDTFERIRGSSPAIRRTIALAKRVASSQSAVLLLGESGTGKELLAEAIHRASPRVTGPFVQVHCAALSQGLLESELFGHVKGAFTGADRDRVGRFQQADGGTLFLDEIGDISLETQVKLLRVLQEMAFEKVGSSQLIRVDVRIVAATHQDLRRLIRDGRFREDLYYRLNVFSLQTPPLRERREDIFELAVWFLHRSASRLGKTVTHLDEAVVEILTAHDWPGNVRQLENAIERAVVLCDGPALTVEDLPPELLTTSAPQKARSRAARAVKVGVARSEAPRERAAGWGSLDREFLDYERERLLDALRESAGNKSHAARMLGIPRSTLLSKLAKHGISGADDDTPRR